MRAYSICLHDDADEDLEQLWRSDEDAAAEITALLEQIQADQYLLESLSIHDYGVQSFDSFNVQQWAEQQRSRRNIWRLKIWDLEDRGIRYRIIYAFDPRSFRYHVLGVVNRDFNYDAADPRSQRIITAYDALDIPGY